MSQSFLANENVPYSIVSWLRERGQDVLYAAESLQGADDRTILNQARLQGRILLTFDRDFGELVFREKRPPAPDIALFRLHHQGPQFLLSFLKTFFESDVKLDGFFTVASPGQLRQIALESKS